MSILFVDGSQYLNARMENGYDGQRYQVSVSTQKRDDSDSIYRRETLKLEDFHMLMIANRMVGSKR